MISTNRKIVENDRLRKRFIQEGDIKGFLKTYEKPFDIDNLNTGNFWDEIFIKTGKLSDQSPMTKDKISIIANFIPRKPVRILDLGIGQGFLEEILIKRKVNYKLEGIDISGFAIRRARKLLNGNFIKYDVLKIKEHYDFNTFDIIAALELLEHISPSKLFVFYKNINSLLKKNGKFIISIPINEKLHLKKNNPSSHVRDYSYPIIKTELQFCGFEISEIRYLYAFDKFYKLKKLLSKILVNKWQPNSLIIVAKKKL